MATDVCKRTLVQKYQWNSRIFLYAAKTVFNSLYNKKEVMLINDNKSIEKLISENRDKFCVDPLDNHSERFLFKLNYRIRHFINIVPYLVKVAIATLLIFAASVDVWNSYIRKDRNEISLKDKISLIIHRVF
jgi:hypothetical protein